MNQKRVLEGDKETGRRVRARRMEIGMTQEQLGNALGLTFQQVQKYEKGVNRIGAGRLQQISKVLKIPVSFFFGESSSGSGVGSQAFSLLQTTHSLRVLKAFDRIKDHRIQRSTVELIEAIADASGTRKIENK
jgi:transcriptional regulator with XRE-family HTH domain